jgi:hypothetical protein
MKTKEMESRTTIIMIQVRTKIAENFMMEEGSLLW